MNNKDIQEMYFIVNSCKNNLHKKYNHQFDEQVNTKCEDFCKKHNINITHGSAFKELRHKLYYYIDKNIDGIIKGKGDIYGLYENGIILDKQIVERFIRQKEVK